MTRTSYFLSGLILLGACSKAPDVAKRKQPVFEPVIQPAAYELLAKDDSRNIVSLPLHGDARNQKHFWSGDYWPSKKGSINRRWNAPIRIGFNHRSPTLDEFRLMPEEKISQLAPSEKFDLLLGAYDYPMRKEVNQMAANQDAEIWDSMINGWAVSSFLHVEPQPKTLVNADGVSIPFGSEDIKGLLAYYYSYHHKPEANASVGKPCQMRGCKEDVTAATFHLALANTIGVKKQAFIMDLDRTREVWNHPVVAYEAEYRGEALLHDKVTPGTHSVVRMKTTVTFIDEALNQTWLPVIATNNQLETKQIYQYWLHLDREGNVIGGEWKSNERPDYLWTMAPATRIKGTMERLNDLIDDPQPVIVTETEVTEPEVTEPEVTEPEVIEPEVIEEEVIVE